MWWWLCLFKIRDDSQLELPPTPRSPIPAATQQSQCLCKVVFWITSSFLGAKAYNINRLLGADVHIRNTVQPIARKSQLAVSESWVNFIWRHFGRGLTNHCCLQCSAWVFLPTCRARGSGSCGAPSSLNTHHCLLAIRLQSGWWEALVMRRVTISPLKPAVPPLAGCPAAFVLQEKALC